MEASRAGGSPRRRLSQPYQALVPTGPSYSAKLSETLTPPHPAQVTEMGPLQEAMSDYPLTPPTLLLPLGIITFRL